MVSDLFQERRILQYKRQRLPAMAAVPAIWQISHCHSRHIGFYHIDRSYLDQLRDYSVELKSQLMINAVKCLGILKFEPAKDRILALSRTDPDLAVRDASLEALKKF